MYIDDTGSLLKNLTNKSQMMENLKAELSASEYSRLTEYLGSKSYNSSQDKVYTNKSGISSVAFYDSEKATYTYYYSDGSVVSFTNEQAKNYFASTPTNSQLASAGADKAVAQMISETS